MSSCCWIYRCALYCLFYCAAVDLTLNRCIQFNQSVRIRSIVIKSSVPAQQPRLIKIFINRPSLGFSDVEDAKEPDAAQIIELTEDQLTEGKRIPLRFVRFQSVGSLHVRLTLLRISVCIC